MTKFAEFDKAVCRQLRNDMDALLAKYAQEHGIKFHVGNMKFTAESVKIIVEATVEGGVSQKQTKQQTDLAYFAAANNVSTNEMNGRRLVGYNSRAHKMPWIYQDVRSGKLFKCSTSTARIYFPTSRTLIGTM